MKHARFAGGLLVLLAASAGACPSCAGRQDGGGALLWLAALIAVPIVAALATGAAVARVVFSARGGTMPGQPKGASLPSTPPPGQTPTR